MNLLLWKKFSSMITIYKSSNLSDSECKLLTLWSPCISLCRKRSCSWMKLMNYIFLGRSGREESGSNYSRSEALVYLCVGKEVALEWGWWTTYFLDGVERGDCARFKFIIGKNLAIRNLVVFSFHLIDTSDEKRTREEPSEETSYLHLYFRGILVISILFLGGK